MNTIYQFLSTQVAEPFQETDCISLAKETFSPQLYLNFLAGHEFNIILLYFIVYLFSTDLSLTTKEDFNLTIGVVMTKKRNKEAIATSE